MALLTAGYWQTTYWPASYWADDYWQDYGEVAPPSALILPSVVSFSRTEAEVTFAGYGLEIALSRTEVEVSF